MKAIGINGSPRKTWNTAMLLEKALEGAGAEGAETKLMHLYGLSYKGCISCFSCKEIGGKSYGRCAVKDELTPLLEEISEADVLIVGSPIYFRTETGEARSFLERLLFPYLTYTPTYESIFPGKLRTALIYTMNVTEQNLAAFGLDRATAASQGTMTRIFGNCEMLLSTNTLQFQDYSKYLCTAFDAAAKADRRREVFPQDCVKAYEMGAKLVASARY